MKEQSSPYLDADDILVLFDEIQKSSLPYEEIQKSAPPYEEIQKCALVGGEIRNVLTGDEAQKAPSEN